MAWCAACNREEKRLLFSIAPVANLEAPGNNRFKEAGGKR